MSDQSDTGVEQDSAIVAALKLLTVFLGGMVLFLFVIAAPIFVGFEAVDYFELSTEVALLIGINIGLLYWGISDYL